MTETPAELIAEHNRIDDFITSENKKMADHLKPHKERLEAIKQELHRQLLEANGGRVDGKANFSFDAGTAYLSTIVTPKVTDKEKYLDFILEAWDERGAMLQIGAPQKDALTQYQDANEGKLPPFVETSSFTRVNIRRS